MEICTDNLLVPLVLKWYVLYAHKALCVAYYFEAYFKSLLKEKVKLYSFSMEKMEICGDQMALNLTCPHHVLVEWKV